MPTPILHILGSAQPDGTGVARIVQSLAEGLDPALYQIHALFLGPDGPLVEELRKVGVDACVIEWWRGARDPLGACRFLKYLRRHEFAIVHQHFGARSVQYLIGLASDASLVLHLHGRVSESGSVGTRRPPSRPDRAIAVSRAVAMEYLELTPVVVYTGVEVPIETQPTRVRRDVVIIGTACRLVPIKGLLFLVRAVSMLSSEFPNLVLEIAGTGPQREELEAEAVRLGLADRIRFSGWRVDSGAMFRSWDICAVPSIDEGFPLAALEAMSEGLPVVATAVGGLPEVVVDGETGYLVPPSNVDALAARIRALIRNPELCRKMGDAGRHRVLNAFPVSSMVSEIAGIYALLMSDREKSR